MNRDNNLIDSLLKEHAKMKNDKHKDELFLEELERRPDEEESNTQIESNEKVVYLRDNDEGYSNKFRWSLGIGVAACAAIGYMGYQSFKMLVVKMT